MTTHAHAAVLVEPGRLELQELALPRLVAGEAILRVEACGLCGSDHELFSGVLRADLPLVPGHEIVGTIEAATDEFCAARAVGPGDRVAVEVFQRCGECEPCRAGAYPLCRRHGLADSYGNTPLSSAPALWGGYATHLFLARDSLVHRVPDGLDASDATLFNPLGAGLRWAVTLPQLEPGAVVAVLGPGLRGLCAVVAAVDAGASFVLLTGAGAADASRLALGRSLGANVVVDVTTADARAVLKQETGGLADVVVDVTAAAPEAFLQSLDLARPGGKVVVAGTRGDRVVERFNPDRILFKELTLLGARGVDGVAYRAALDLLARDRRLTEVPRTSVPLVPTAIAGLLNEMAHGEMRPLHAVVVPTEAR